MELSINEATLKTLEYIEKTRGLGLIDQALKKTLEYIEKTRRLNKRSVDYNYFTR